jgi:hypothetical protein
MSVVVNEADKPFIIAMILVCSFVALIFIGAVGVLIGNIEIIDYVYQMIGNITGIVGTILAFYFGTKMKE